MPRTIPAASTHHHNTTLSSPRRDERGVESVPRAEHASVDVTDASNVATGIPGAAREEKSGAYDRLGLRVEVQEACQFVCLAGVGLREVDLVGDRPGEGRAGAAQ